MSEQRSTTPSGTPPLDNAADGAPSADAAAPARPDDAPPGPLDPNSSQEGPSRRAFTVSMPLRPPAGPDGANEGAPSGPGDFITWTFELLPGPPHTQPDGTGPQAPTDQTGNPNPDGAPRIGPFGLAGARPPDRPAQTPFPPGMDLIFGSLDHREILRGLMPLFASGLGDDRRPDPAKAAELIRALPTVDKAMMDRVDRVIVAADSDEDDETGWKCSICLEGAEVAPAEGSAAIKATPCHHLFHSGCLEPWFQTKTSCPMCRESLDSLRTQTDSEQRPSVRPPPSRTPTPSTHPYARPSATRSSPRPSPMAIPDITDTTSAPDPPSQAETSGEGASGSTDPSTTLTASAELAAEAAPSDIGPGALDMAGSSNAAGARTAPAAAFPMDTIAPRGDSTPRRIPIIPFPGPPRPELGAPIFRMPFMAVINVGPNGPEPPRQITPPVPSSQGLPSDTGLTDGPIHTSPMPMERVTSPVPHLSGVPQSGSGTSAPTDPPRTGPVAVTPESSSESHHHHHHHHYHHHHQTQGADQNSAPASGPLENSGTSNIRPPGPRFTIFTRNPQPPVAQSPPLAPARPSLPRPSLASYILSKERDLGLTCAAMTCKYAHEADSIQEEKEDLLSIRAAPSAESSMPKFACAHKWHKDCLGDTSPQLAEDCDVDGKLWTACGVCGAKGWVMLRDDARSEGEVERLVHAR